VFPHLHRIIVIGTSCSGKTSYAKRLADILGSPHVELDALHWNPNWIEKPADEFRALVSSAVAADRWIVDGNYGTVRDLVWPRATSVIWLNYAFPIVMGRAIRRTLRRALSGEELYSGNKESIRMAFFSRDSILVWVATTYRSRRRRYQTLQKSDAYPHLQWFEFKTLLQSDQFLKSLHQTVIRSIYEQ
jgi:adenylate kinase family enzyme